MPIVSLKIPGPVKDHENIHCMFTGSAITEPCSEAAYFYHFLGQKFPEGAGVDVTSRSGWADVSSLQIAEFAKKWAEFLKTKFSDTITVPLVTEFITRYDIRPMLAHDDLLLMEYNVCNTTCISMINLRHHETPAEEN